MQSEDAETETKAVAKNELTERTNEIDKEGIREAFAVTGAYNCLECGKCTGICPVALLGAGFSPRLVVKKALLNFEEDLCADKDRWECLTCDLCRIRCRSDVNLPEFIRRLRYESLKIGNTYNISHNNVFNLISKLQLKAGDFQKRLAWVTPDIKYHQKGDTLFFVGCAPYFQSIFRNLNQDNLELPLASLKLLNAAGIEPVLLENERCCGHDSYWTGGQDTFERLLELNIDNFKNAGVKKIITACPEGHHMLKNVYPEYSDDFNFECVHITELLAEKIDSGELEIPDDPDIREYEVVSYHDPCRLGRFSGIFEAPRKIISAIPGLEFRELSRNRQSSTCCGVNSFVNCDMNSKLWRAEKLKDAESTGATTLLTSCPKCNIHLNCYVTNQYVEPKFDIKIDSLIVRLAKEINLMPKE